MKKKGTLALILLALAAFGILATTKVMAVPNHGVVFPDYTYTFPPSGEPYCVCFYNGTCWVDYDD